ncbi:hypothetical protein FLO80_02275 [Aquicoccus porphyridii]|uniref:Uncharacterized protein n=1 Tax=Aquicoccus porphyridii TaxID=1852029 RepID=A0A5A9ZV15_9RHOB|nr:hypothetical protein [Aquicoccus porphyridii]KAA0921019.1 hypothetical protein FLO80_02275 [Aquicoccus porphyridii]RAI56444.1 hypothetical protein DOO74_00805 [Rhodobacteraceae bacterium AsT-22]
MIRFFILALALISTTPAFAQSFSCRIGTRPACLDYGDTVCSSTGKCVDANAACFDTYQCNYEGFTCRSNVTECVEEHDDLLRKHNKLVRDYNDLLERNNELVSDYNALLERNNELVSDYNALLERSKRAQSLAEDTERCVRWATTLNDAQSCY